MDTKKKRKREEERRKAGKEGRLSEYLFSTPQTKFVPF